MTKQDTVILFDKVAALERLTVVPLNSSMWVAQKSYQCGVRR